MHSDKNELNTVTEIPDLQYKMKLLKKNLFSDDISKTKNRLWVFKDKLSDHDTFNDFGYLVSIKISDYDAILKEYDSNVANKLLKLVSNYIIEYMKENHLNYEIVRYSGDNFLIFIYELNEEKVEEHIVNIQKSMSNYRFKHRHKVFNLTFYFAVMQYVKNESFSSVLDQLDEKLFLTKH